MLVTLGYTQQWGMGPVFNLNVENSLIQSSSCVILHQHLMLYKCLLLWCVWEWWTLQPIFTRVIHFSHTNTLYLSNCPAEKCVRACLFCSWSVSLLKQKKHPLQTLCVCIPSSCNRELRQRPIKGAGDAWGTVINMHESQSRPVM